MKKRFVAGVLALTVVAALAVTGSAARSQTKYNNGFTFTSSISAPAPNYTTYYTSRITPDNHGGSYNHQGTIYISGSARGLGWSGSLYTNSTPGITRAIDNMGWYATGMTSAYATTDVSW